MRTRMRPEPVECAQGASLCALGFAEGLRAQRPRVAPVGSGRNARARSVLSRCTRCNVCTVTGTNVHVRFFHRRLTCSPQSRQRLRRAVPKMLRTISVPAVRANCLNALEPVICSTIDFSRRCGVRDCGRAAARASRSA